MADRSRSDVYPAAQEPNEKSVLGAAGRRTTVAGSMRLRRDDRSARDATRQLFVGLALAGGVVPTA